MKYTYQMYEDNGGGLHLFVLNSQDQVVDGITNLEYAPAGEWENVKTGLSLDPLEEVSWWDGHMEDHDIDPQEFYDTFLDDQTSDLVAEDGIIYPARMGAAARKYFGITGD